MVSLTGPRVLRISLLFVLFDFSITLFGIAWDGSSLSISNLIRWFNLPEYSFYNNPLDFLLISTIRSIIVLTGGILAYRSPEKCSLFAQKFSSITQTILLVIVSFAPSKLLAFYEKDTPSLAVGAWILMVWCVLASFIVLVMWIYLFSKLSTEVSPEIQVNGSEVQEDEKELDRKSAFDLLFRLYGYMLREWKAYSIAFVFLFVYSLSRAFVPYYTGQVIAAVTDKDGSYERLHTNVIYLAAFSVSQSIFGGLRGGAFTYGGGLISRQLRNDLFRALVKQEIGFFDKNPTGELLSRLSADTQTVTTTMSTYFNVFLRNSTMLITSLVLMWHLSWKMTMVTLITVPMLFLVNKVFGSMYERISEKTQKTIAEANEVAEEVFSSIRTVKSFACENNEAERFMLFLNKTFAIARFRCLSIVGYVWSNELLQMFILTLVLWYGGHLVVDSKITSDLLISFLLYQFQLGDNLQSMGDVWTGLMQCAGASRKIFNLMDRMPIIPNDGSYKPTSLEGRIEFRNVKFSYPGRPDVTVLEDLSFTAEPGQVVALVGPSGGGKSSCIAMLEHFYEPTEGQVLLDGVAINEYDHKYLHTKVALVGQEPVLYARSVTENIGYGLDEYTDEQVENSAIHSNAHDFIKETHEGYKTNVGEKGSQMSGGQKQRIAIARALVRSPVVLLLDEATSALDAESEHMVQAAISKNLQGRTVILIAHRLSTVENADKIVVISEGKVVQQGRHVDLITEDGLYKTLVQHQLHDADLDDLAAEELDEIERKSGADFNARPIVGQRMSEPEQKRDIIGSPILALSL